MRKVVFIAVVLTATALGAAAGAGEIGDCTTGADAAAGSLAVVPGSGPHLGGTDVASFTIEVESGLALDHACLTDAVDDVLGDPRSWVHSGDIGWLRVSSGADVRIIFASPSLTDQLCLPLNTGGIFSCRVGNRVVLNVWRWRTGTAEYAADLDEYRRYMINHEVGHWLGHGHTSCPSPGAVAPVMMQQTKGLDGCTRNGWPYPDAPVIPATWDGTFWDDDGSIFEADIEWIAAAGITYGCGPDRYCPDSPVTRGQMAAFVDRAVGLPPTTEDFFTDDDGSLFEGSINRLAAARITFGCAPESFCPEAQVTRGQMAAFLVRAFDLPNTDADAFADDAGSLFEQDINRLAVSGITRGCGVDTFCPTDPVTRAQMAAFLRRSLTR